MKFETIQKALNLSPLPVEGGFFYRFYTSKDKVDSETERHCASAIMYAISNKQHSDWHRLTVDEIWSHQGTSTAIQILVSPSGDIEIRKLGLNIEEGQLPVSVIPAGYWQTTRLMTPSEDAYALFSVVVPEFTEECFEPSHDLEMIQRFPELNEVLHGLSL